jgi:pyridoxine 4-dehydrogenase
LGENPARITEVLGPIARRHGVTVQQIVLAWQLHRSPVSLPVPRYDEPRNLKENLAAAAIRLEPEKVAAITALAS